MQLTLMRKGLLQLPFPLSLGSLFPLLCSQFSPLALSTFPQHTFRRSLKRAEEESVNKGQQHLNYKQNTVHQMQFIRLLSE